jgi:CheY-like chemotaxis protein
VTHVVAEEAADGWSALRIIVKREPDLIILDMNLPVLSGYLTARMVRAWGGRFADLPILALTAAVEPDARAQCLRGGCQRLHGQGL